MGLSTDRFEYLREVVRENDREDPEYTKNKAMYRKIREFCTACNTPDPVCQASVCHFYSLKIKAISDESSENRHFGAYKGQRFEMKGREK
jgi:hypothetical protein